MKIAIFGTGYVGLSLATLLAGRNDVVAVDINQAKVDLINARKSPIKDAYIEEYLSTKELKLLATADAEFACNEADFVIVCTPTNYDEKTNYFDTSAVESVIQTAATCNPNATIVIKSTIPIGFTKRMQGKYPQCLILFSPEFLREGKALYDNLYPSRIIVGADDQNAKSLEGGKAFADLLAQACLKDEVPSLIMNTTEAEAVKLFANTYLAMRVSFFNELDNYAMATGIEAKNVIEGICLDPRIGAGYNNPSFGYGGYCLPKDTKQLKANYGTGIPQNLISAIVASNDTRKDFIAEQIAKLNPKIVGIYRLIMKADSDNFRQSAILDIITKLKQRHISIMIFEPAYADSIFEGMPVVNDEQQFLGQVDVIIANRKSSSLLNSNYRVFSRDIFSID